MRNTLLIETLSWLNPDDIHELHLFVQSEFHNRGNNRDEIIRLFTILAEMYPSFDSVKLEKDNLYPCVFPGVPKINSKLEKLFSELYKLVKNYLTWKQYHQAENNFQRSMDWAKLLKSYLPLHKLEATLDKIEKEFLTGTPYSPQFFYDKYQLERMRQKWKGEMNKGKEDINLNNCIYCLYLFFEVARLEMSNQLLLQEKITRVEISEKVRKLLHLDPPLIHEAENPIIDILFQINQLLKVEVPEYEQFKNLLSLLRRYESQLNSDILKLYYAYLRNVCTIIINAGHEELLSMLHELQRDNLERGYLYINGKLHTNTLANLTRIAISTGNIDWAISCIETHKNKMFGDIETNDYYLINKALCLFAQSKYQLVLDILPASSPNILYHLIARRLELMCYYELQSDLLLHKLEAFKIYIWRASEKFLSENLKQSNKAFINFFLQLVTIPANDKAKLARLERRIKEKKHLSESKWLLSKVHFSRP
jgi:hypothetical protein